MFGRFASGPEADDVFQDEGEKSALAVPRERLADDLPMMLRCLIGKLFGRVDKDALFADGEHGEVGAAVCVADAVGSFAIRRNDAFFSQADELGAPFIVAGRFDGRNERHGRLHDDGGGDDVVEAEHAADGFGVEGGGG